MASSSINSIGSDCITGLNSVRFRHDDLDSFGESSGSGVETKTGSLVSLSDIEVPGSLFNVASGGDTESFDMPDHWQAASTSSDTERGGGESGKHSPHRVRGTHGRGSRGSTLGNIEDDAEFLPGESLESYRAFCTISSLVGGSESVDSSGVEFWSGSDESYTSSHLWDLMDESSIKTTESRLPTDGSENRKSRRKLYVRRCAKAMVGFVALAALSMSVVYLIAEGGYESLIEFLPGKVRSGRLFGGDGDDASEEQKEKLRHLGSPQSNREDMVPDPPEDGGNDDRGGEIPPQERNQRAWAQRILAHERRVGAPLAEGP